MPELVMTSGSSLASWKADFVCMTILTLVITDLITDV